MRRAGCAVLCAALLALPGCGDGDEEPASTATAAAPRNFFAVSPQAQLTPEDLERMATGQVGTVRLFLPWGVIDPTAEPDDDYVYTEIDPVVLDAARNGIDVLPFLYGTPAWAAQSLDGVECEVDCSAFAPRSEEALAVWRNFIDATVERYGPDGTLWSENPDVPARPIRVWQIWNEQNSPTFYQPEPDVASYARVLDAASETIRDRDPGATVLLGGMFGTPLNGEVPAYTAWGFLRELYEIEGNDGSFDAVAAHPYAARQKTVELQVERIHDEIARAGDDDATLWITELGWASSGPDVPLNRGPEGQAQALTDAFSYFLERRLDWRIEGVTWYSWRDTSVPICDWCPESGLFEEESLDEPKPSWDAFTALSGGS